MSPVQRLVRSFRRAFDSPAPQEGDEIEPLTAGSALSQEALSPKPGLSSPRGRRARAAKEAPDHIAWRHDRVCEEAAKRLARSSGGSGMGDFDFTRFVGWVVVALRAVIARQDLTARELTDCLVTAIFCETLGHRTDFAYIHAVNVAAMPDVPLRMKRLGYLLCGLCLPPGDERFLLLVNGIQKDLRSDDPGVICTALTACVRVITEDAWPPVADLVWRLAEHRDGCVRKRAVLALQRFYRLAGKDLLSLNFSTAADYALKLLSEEALSVPAAALSSINFATELVASVDVRPGTPTELGGGAAALAPLLDRALAVADGMIFPHLHPDGAKPTLFTQVALLRLLAAVCDKLTDAVPPPTALRIGEVLHGFLKKAWRQGLPEGSFSSCTSPLGKGSDGAPRDLPPTAAALVYQVLWVLGRESLLSLTRMDELSHVVQAASECIQPLFASADKNQRYVALRCCGLLALVDDNEARTRQRHIVEAIHGGDAPVIVAAADVLSQMARAENTKAVVQQLMRFAARPPRSWSVIGSDAGARLRRHLVAQCYRVAWREAGVHSPVTLLWAITELPRRFPLLPPPPLSKPLLQQREAAAAPAPTQPHPIDRTSRSSSASSLRRYADPPAVECGRPKPLTQIEETTQDVLAWLRDAVALRDGEQHAGAADVDPERVRLRGQCCDLLRRCLTDDGSTGPVCDALHVGVVARGTHAVGHLRPLPTRAAAWAMGEFGPWNGTGSLSDTCAALCDALRPQPLQLLLLQDGGGVAAAGALLALTKLVCVYTHLRLAGAGAVLHGRDTSLAPTALLDVRSTFDACARCVDTTVAAAAREGASLLEVALQSLSDAAAAQSKQDFFGAEMGAALPLFAELSRPCATTSRVEDQGIDRSLGCLSHFVSARSAEIRAGGGRVREYLPKSRRGQDAAQATSPLRFEAYATGSPGVAALTTPVEVRLNPKTRLWGREGYAGGRTAAGSSDSEESDGESASSGGSESALAPAATTRSQGSRGKWLEKALGGATSPPPRRAEPDSPQIDPSGWSQEVLRVPDTLQRRWGPSSAVEPIPMPTPDGGSFASSGRRRPPKAPGETKKRPRRARRGNNAYQQLEDPKEASAASDTASAGYAQERLLGRAPSSPVASRAVSGLSIASPVPSVEVSSPASDVLERSGSKKTRKKPWPKKGSWPE
eukprot:TRINITY_DN19358_c0_g1_i1.p1 TRINITY_DN19358_c0_g1~~TRINITY_DN19358_c0_g1_i1.p1  ORF type:complete len:1174 (+),score=302.24 TRINITY_DN19358_c0_g1_i1:252-3773(+)